MTSSPGPGQAEAGPGPRAGLPPASHGHTGPVLGTSPGLWCWQQLLPRMATLGCGCGVTHYTLGGKYPTALSLPLGGLLFLRSLQAQVSVLPLPIVG